MSETRSKCCYKSQEDSNQHSTNPHYKEFSDSSKYINGLNCAHLAERLEQIVQHLRKKESALHLRILQQFSQQQSAYILMWNFIFCPCSEFSFEIY